jgi:hypothetical protein
VAPVGELSRRNDILCSCRQNTFLHDNEDSIPPKRKATPPNRKREARCDPARSKPRARTEPVCARTGRSARRSPRWCGGTRREGDEPQADGDGSEKSDAFVVPTRLPVVGLRRRWREGTRAGEASALARRSAAISCQVVAVQALEHPSFLSTVRSPSGTLQHDPAPQSGHTDTPSDRRFRRRSVWPDRPAWAGSRRGRRRAARSLSTPT